MTNKDNTSMTLAPMLQKRGWTIAELEVALEKAHTPISRSSLNAYIAGLRGIGFGNLIAIANVLECTTDDVLGRWAR